MRYANIIFDGNRKGAVNIGDDLQLVALENLYREMNIDYDEVIRIGLSKLTTYDGEYVILPISFPLYGYREGLNITMFSPKIIPVFLGLSIFSGSLSEEEVSYLTRFEPIGCRDSYTMNLLRRKNILAYLNGCMTATFPYVKERCGTKVYLVDVPKKYYPFIPEDLRKDAIIRSQVLENCDDPEEEIKKYIKEYCTNARLVITTRLHCAWPCVASGIPVVLMKDKFSYRFTALEKYLHAYTAEEFEKIDWNPIPADYEDMKKNILENAKERMHETYVRYEKMFSISQYYETANITKPIFIEHYDNVIEDVCNTWNETDYIEYAIWGITQKSDLICSYMEKYFKNSKLVTVYDRAKEVEFHGVDSTQDIAELLNKGVFVFVTAATANESAVKLFSEIDKKNYHISTDGIGE